MAAVGRRKRRTTEWGWRLAGVTLCAFFGLGVLAGLGLAGRAGALPGEASVLGYGRRLMAGFGPGLRHAPQAGSKFFSNRLAGAPVALVERGDGFYALLPTGELRGPVAPAAQGDLPTLSGPGLDNARASQLLDYAAVLVRAEAALAEMVSEMRLAGDGTAALYLERSRTELDFDLARAAPELEHAAAVLARWRGHRRLIAALDMTVPGQAVMRLTVALPLTGAGGPGPAKEQSSPSPAAKVRGRSKELASG